MRRTRRLLLLVGLVAAVAAAPVAVVAQAASTPTASFAKVSEWGSGWEGRYTITNGGSTEITSWRVEFDLPAGTTVGSHWNATLVSSGQRHTFGNLSWNGRIAPGASVTFGFIGSGTGAPNGCRLNGQPCGGGTGPSPTPTVSPTGVPPTVPPGGRTPVAANGQLRVCGRQLCNAAGKAIQLRGMSTHGLQWYANCATPASLDVLAREWQADVLRISMYIQEGGYETDPRRFTDLVHDYIELATARGMYAIVDWHMLTPGDPNHNLERAGTFFAEIADRHRAKNNVIYEIANEPNGVAWSAIKSYADQIIPVIRTRDADAVVLVGTPDWSSLGASGEGGGADVIAANPVSAGNVMYVFHFYAASHDDYYLDTVTRAADLLPLFVTEFGTQDYSGDGPNDFTMAQRYLDLFASRKISWVNWNFSDDFRSGAVFTTGTCAAGAFGGTARLKEAGVWIRDRIRTPDDF
ncbi:cellulase family glycosylhydrolase [Plantactinospora sp. KLBMP9567]|uniref:cellulase family glycosylhydrolase n=1 Tax=Plantactinospora sp. KLBMP9567 TaxID=3085900 RepID=UPI002981B524|nr:cellulase family glycosylhydrolase [Plantactinospora sp. KLBMP9567]MDW5330325.1 cellulase family glycosylhydrolase [Plantactinospora sp. KLBMP9567]